MRYPRRSFATVMALGMLLALAGQAEAQGRGRGRGFRVPPGHMPGPGMCRVWYPGVPPGHQPAAVPCRALRGYRFRGAIVLEGPRRGRDFAYWDEGWGRIGDGLRIFASFEHDGIRFEYRDDGRRFDDRDRDRDRDRGGRGRGR